MKKEISEEQVEAARYVVLRRLSPALRHHLIRHLQPIGLIYEVLDHKLAAPAPDISHVHQHTQKINGFAKAALAQSLDISTWLAPEAGSSIALGNGVRECTDLLSASLNFRGYQTVNNVGDITPHVGRDALRAVLIAALFAVTDALTEPSILTLGASTDAGRAGLSIRVESTGEGQAELYDDGYRKVMWSDVEALAFAEDVRVSREDGLVKMSFEIRTAPHSH